MEVRVAGVLIHNGKLLMAKHCKGGEEYWVLPGGHVEKRETLAQALEREFLEETRLSVETGDLLFVNDFIRRKPDPKRHVINLRFEVRARDLSPLEVVPQGALSELRFFDADELKDLPIRPDIGGILVGLLQGRRPSQIYLGPL